MGEWLSLMEYATRNNVSLSTLRRQIKTGKLKPRSEHGRYLLWYSKDQSPAPNGDVAELQLQLKKAREEIAELKTLLAFYEEQSPQSGLTI